MNAPIAWFEQPLVERVGWTLLHFVWQGAALAVVAAVVLIALRKRSANTRYITALAALGAMAVCPLVTFALLAPVRDGHDHRPELSASAAAAPVRMGELIESDLPGSDAPRSGAADEFPVVPADDDRSAPPLATDAANGPHAPAAEADLTQAVASRLAPVLPYLVVVWLCGVTLLSMRLLGSWWCIERLRRRGTGLLSADWENTFRGLCERMGVRRPVKLLQSGLIRVPAAMGWLRPAILLPASGLTGLSPREIESLILHELAHIRRHDYIVNLAQSVVETMLFYHPAVWWISHRIRVERENCCDDAVLCVSGDRKEYARALVHIADVQHQSPGLAAAAVGGELTQSVRRVLGLPPARSPAWASLAGGVILLVVTCTLFTILVLPPETAAVRAEDPKSGRESPATRPPDDTPDGPDSEGRKVIPVRQPSDVEVTDRIDDALRDRIRQAVARGVGFLKTRQRTNGDWAPVNGHFAIGVTALATLSLLQSGLDTKDPQVAAAINWLAEAQPDRTYDVALQTLVFCRADAERFQAAIRRNVEWLSRTQLRAGAAAGAWTYRDELVGGLFACDNSNTGFALWALDAAAEAGLRADDAVWLRSLDYLTRGQNADGSWLYATPATAGTRSIPGTGSMTCSGIAGVAICTDRLAEANGEEPPDVNDPVERGFHWLAQHFSVKRNPGAHQWPLYYLNAMQRAARRTKRATIGNHDWYREGARHLVTTQQPAGDWRSTGSVESDPVIATSLALLFLKNGDGVDARQVTPAKAEEGAAPGARDGTANQIGPNVRKEQAAATTPDGDSLLTPETRDAIDRGLRSLVRSQQDDGAIGSGENYRKNVAVSALAAMAFLAAGSTPERGEYAQPLRKCRDFVLNQMQRDGYITHPDFRSHGPMYGHAYAVQFLAVLQTRHQTAEVRETLQRAVDLLVRSQNNQGGWRYEPDSQSADISVTACQTVALELAAVAGANVPKETLERALDYIRKCQNPDGGFRYQLVQRVASRFPRSAAAWLALELSEPKGLEVTAARAYVGTFQPVRDAEKQEPHFLYGHRYAALAMQRVGGDAWREWYAAIRDSLVRRQNADGTWAADGICPEYGTASACIILQLPATGEVRDRNKPPADGDGAAEQE